MKRAGVTILAGTDGPYTEGGDALHSELDLLVEAGLTPLQALQAASLGRGSSRKYLQHAEDQCRGPQWPTVLKG